MSNHDSLQFVQQRLRRNHSPLHRELRLASPERVRRRIAMELADGSNHVFDWVDASVMICCTSGSLWITHDGDPKDIIVKPGESYRAETDRAMYVSALGPSVIEIEFEDDALPN